MIRIAMILLLMLPVLTQSVMAQPDAPTIFDINFGQVVEDSITQVAIFDWWRIRANEGDEIVVDMLASDGLQPLLGILDGGGDLVARTEDEEGTVNSRIQLEFTIPAEGLYTVVATRVGNENGTSTGSYKLRVDQAASATNDFFRQVTFRCDEGYEVVSAAVIDFGDDLEFQSGRNVISVYGLDGFVPVLRLRINPAIQAEALEFCEEEGRVAPGDTIIMPGEAAVTIQPGEEHRAAQHIVAVRGSVELIIGSRDGVAGRFIAVISGFAINDQDDIDRIIVGQGALAAETSSLYVYMIGVPASRLDPYMILTSDEVEELLDCDDAGRRGCEDVPVVQDAGVIVTSENLSVIGDRFDAGLRIDGVGPQRVELQSFGQRTDGMYHLLVIGELPARDAES